ncbi:Putative protease [hydrothermal vent metagenome]|uniref:Protease n=1 Tax=hydrothermal vent metagenome TaxID=652676 RepID=A0A3B0ZN49_9ZZZZ
MTDKNTVIAENSADISYEIIPCSPEAHVFRVTLTLSAPASNKQQFYIPAWIPGSYMIRDFARNIVSFKAWDAQGTVDWHKKDKQTWVCENYTDTLCISYEVYAWEMSVRAAHLDTTHAYFNGTSVFMAVREQEQNPCRILLSPPQGEQYSNWKVATALSAESDDLYQFGWYTAANYDELIDHPVEIGEFDLVTFEVSGVPHDLAVYGSDKADFQRMAKDLKIICEHHIALFGELPAMERYVFLLMCPGSGYGGLEHRASCSLICSRDDLPREHETGVSDQYRQFLGLCSHEYFHTWNIKRIKPAVFIPYALESEVHTRLLWAFEGITSYYDELALCRTGLISIDSYLELLAQTLTRLIRGQGRFKQSVTESSFDAWTRFYKQDENAPNSIVSYYVKGAVIACALDLMIRHESGDHKSLDDVMRVLWESYGKPGKGVAETEFESIVEEVTGLDLSEFFESALYGTDDIEISSLLRLFGVEMILQPASSMTDKGGKSLARSSEEVRADAGMRVSTDVLPRVIQVFDKGAAQNAGLSAGDILLAVDGFKIDGARYESRLNRYRPGQTVIVSFFRHEKLMQLSMELQAVTNETCYLQCSGDTRGWLAIKS